MRSAALLHLVDADGPGAGLAFARLACGHAGDAPVVALGSRPVPGCEARIPVPAGSVRLAAAALERLVEANTLLSGLGFESAGLAAAHAIHNGLTAIPQTHGYQHGEKVSFGTLVQLVLEGAEQEEVDEVLAFATSVGLPVTLGEIGCGSLTDDELRTVAVQIGRAHV